MKRRKLLFIEGTDRTGKDVICQKLSNDNAELLWINKPRAYTINNERVNSVHAKHLRDDMYIMNSIELTSAASLLSSTNYNVLSNRSHFSSMIYGNDTKKQRIFTDVKSIDNYIRELFDIIMVVLYHADISTIHDVERSGSWHSAQDIVRLTHVNNAYMNFHEYDKSANIFCVNTNYSNSDNIYQQIQQLYVR